MENNRKRYQSFITIGIIGSVYLGVKYILPLIIPFLIAYIVVRIINPVILKIRKKIVIDSGILAGVFLLILMGGLGCALWFLSYQLFFQIKNLIGNLDAYVASFHVYISGFCNHIENLLGIQASVLETMILDNLDLFVRAMKSQIMPKIMECSWGLVQNIIKVVGIGIFTIISIVLLTKEYEEIHKKGQLYFCYQKVNRIIEKIFHIGGTYLKAQLTIMFFVGILCVIGLFILGNPYALLLGLLIGILDALPVFGTGSVFIPWGIVKVLQGDFLSGAILGTIYIVTSLLREFLEPKLIGKKVGVSSLVILASIYVGIELYGIGGFILGPLSLLLIVEIRKELLLNSP